MKLNPMHMRGGHVTQSSKKQGICDNRQTQETKATGPHARPASTAEQPEAKPSCVLTKKRKPSLTTGGNELAVQASRSATPHTKGQTMAKGENG